MITFTDCGRLRFIIGAFSRYRYLRRCHRQIHVSNPNDAKLDLECRLLLAPIRNQIYDMQTTRKAAPATGTTTEARLPVSLGMEDHGDRISFLGVEVAKGRGDPLTPDSKRFAKDVVDRSSYPYNFLLPASCFLLPASCFLLPACRALGSGQER